MFLSRLVPESIVSDQPLPNPTASVSSVSSPDYVELVKFLVQPFLESADALKVDCEIAPRPRRVLIRLAFEGEDKGRVFGRGGRNIQAIRTVLQAVAQTAGYSAHLDIYGSQSGGREGSDDKPALPRSQPRRPSRPSR
jgi:hypothetical protein